MTLPLPWKCATCGGAAIVKGTLQATLIVHADEYADHAVQLPSEIANRLGLKPAEPAAEDVSR